MSAVPGAKDVPSGRKPGGAPPPEEQETVTPREPAKPRARVTRREEPPLRAEPDAKGAAERESRPAARRGKVRESPAVSPQRQPLVEPRHVPRTTAQREKSPRTAQRAAASARPQRVESDSSGIPVIPLPEALRPTRPPAGSPW